MEIVTRVKLWMKRDGLASNGCGWIRTNGNSEIMIKCNRLECRSFQEWGWATKTPHEGACCMHSPPGAEPKKKEPPIPKTYKCHTNAKYTNRESENVNSLPRCQPLKRAQNAGLKTARFQKSQNGTHLTSKFGETIRRIFRARNPIHILKLPFLQGLLNTQKMTN